VHYVGHYTVSFPYLFNIYREKLIERDKDTPKSTYQLKMLKLMSVLIAEVLTREEEIQCAVTREFNNISKTAFLEGMKKLKDHANKCIDQGGMYFEE
jgi:type II secretory ATPase GspE/PulE/Tfp pilus assembly ATPase PilB-like protein